MSRGAFVPKANAPLKRRAAPDAQALSPPSWPPLPRMSAVPARPAQQGFVVLKAGRYFTGMGAWAEAKKRSSARPKAELSGMRLRAGR